MLIDIGSVRRDSRKSIWGRLVLLGGGTEPQPLVEGAEPIRLTAIGLRPNILAGPGARVDRLVYLAQVAHRDCLHREQPDL